MSEAQEQFMKDAAAKTADTALQLKLSSASRQYHKALEEGLTQFSNLETAKRRAAFTRWKALENLDKYLIEFEANFIRSGGKVVWAQDAAEACSEILAIILLPRQVECGPVLRALLLLTHHWKTGDELQAKQVP